jgi:RNA polymerase nonessential primary-like sigma factor
VYKLRNKATFKMLNPVLWSEKDELVEPDLEVLANLSKIYENENIESEIAALPVELLSSITNEYIEEDLPSVDPMDLYLRDISHSPLLTKAQEVYFGRLARDGDMEARARMIESNLRLVVKIARRYVRSNMPISDLIEEGNLGLIKAVEKFDPEKGFRFSTYGAWWIQQNIERAIMSQNRTIRLPVHIMKKLNACLRVSRELAKVLDHEPTAKEIAQQSSRPLHEVENLLSLNEKIVSIDNHVSDEINKPLVDILINNTDDPATIISEKNLTDNVNKWLLCLTPMQKEVIEYRFGLNGKEQTTLEQTGIEIGVTRERVRQLQLEGLRLLRRLIIESGNNLNHLLAD